MYGLSQNGAQHHAEKADAQPAHGAGARAVLGHKARPDDHLAAGAAQGFKNARDVARVVLPVAIHANDVLKPSSKASL